jgi:hypothetical protein
MVVIGFTVSYVGDNCCRGISSDMSSIGDNVYGVVGYEVRDCCGVGSDFNDCGDVGSNISSVNEMVLMLVLIPSS